MSEKYISTSKLKAHYSWLGKDATLSPKDVDDIVDAQPAADVEPVVRCKKCRYWKVIGKDEDEGFCKFRSGYTVESYYCADGKERER